MQVPNLQNKLSPAGGPLEAGTFIRNAVKSLIFKKAEIMKKWLENMFIYCAIKKKTRKGNIIGNLPDG